MREIKFNAVDEDTGEYIKYDEWLEENTEHNDEGFEPLARFLDFYYGFTLLQYTGLKDKNGVEIYEGDILRIITEHDLSVDKSEVFFKDGEFSYWDWCWGNKEKCNYPVCAVASESGVDHEGSHFCEITGNIYENPELLEQK